MSDAVGWSALRGRLFGEYGRMWWQLAYMINPLWRHLRGDLPAPLPVEAATCLALYDYAQEVPL